MGKNIEIYTVLCKCVASRTHTLKKIGHISLRSTCVLHFFFSSVRWWQSRSCADGEEREKRAEECERILGL